MEILLVLHINLIECWIFLIRILLINIVTEKFNKKFDDYGLNISDYVNKDNNK